MSHTEQNNEELYIFSDNISDSMKSKETTQKEAEIRKGIRFAVEELVIALPVLAEELPSAFKQLGPDGRKVIGSYLDEFAPVILSLQRASARVMCEEFFKQLVPFIRMMEDEKTGK